MKKENKIYVAGHNGMVGSNIIKELKSKGYKNIIYADRKILDLTNQNKTFKFFKENNPEYVFLAAAKVGGIMANKEYPADFIYQNIMIESNIIHASFLNNVKKLLFLGSSCIYPKYSKQPIKEDYLLSGYLEPTNDAYAIAKISGIKLCQAYKKQYGCNFISVMPTNLYGKNDNFDLYSSHVIPGMIRKFHEAKINKSEYVTLWGTGKPKREFLYATDLANACIFLMKNYNEADIVNIGYGSDISIKELASLIKKITKYAGVIMWDKTKPDGTPKKLLDSSKLFNKYKWKPKIKLTEGLELTYTWFKEKYEKI